MRSIGNPCRVGLAALFALLSLTGAVRADTLHVPADYPTIQAAIVAAEPGDTVLVAPGTYFETIDFLGKGITVQNGGPSSATIDGNGAGSVVSFVSGEPADATLRGFIIRGGTGSSFEFSTTSWQVGGGVKIVGSHATIEACSIRNNSALDRGGGIFVHNGSGSASLTLLDSLVLTNHVFAYPGALGGGLYSAGGTVSVTNCEFSDNGSNGSGGGFAVQAESPVPGGFTFTNCGFFGNLATFGGGAGWAVLTSGPTTLELVRCSLNSNGAQSGGGLATVAFSGGPSTQALVKLTRSWLYANTAVEGGGATLYTAPFGETTVSSCMIQDNHADGTNGGGLIATGLVNLRGSTIAGNSGGGVRLVSAQGLVDNCIVWGNQGGSILHDAPVPDPIWCDIEGGFPGTGNIDFDPVFICPPCSDYHLTPTSACLDAGNPAWTASGELDIDGDPRVQFGRVDIGADEADFPSGPWTFLGHALPGGLGPPSLAGTGTLIPGSTTKLTVANAPINHSMWFVAGAGTLLAPFKGGVMVPAIDQIIGPFGTGPAGQNNVSGKWPNLPVGFTIVIQVWIQDPSGPAGLTATNGLAAKTQ